MSLVTTIGESVQGRPISVKSFGSGANHILVMSGVHGDEFPCVPLVTDLMEDFAANGSDMEHLTVHFLLEANPDGVVAGTRWNANGVDINRNMEFDWSPVSAGPRMNPGPAPYSEPETVALAKFVLDIEPTRILSVHAFADLIDFDTDGGKTLSEIIATKNGMRVAGIGYPTPGSFGRFCTHHNIPLVTLELPRGRSREEFWDWQRPALWEFLRATI